MDPILYWNNVALDANKRDFTPATPELKPEQGGPTLSSRALAIVHLAMYDAYAGALNLPTLPRYLAAPANPPPGANADASVAAAAYTCLAALYPRQKINFEAALGAMGLSGVGLDAGSIFGRMVGLAMLADRVGDPDASDAGYVPSQAYGAHRVDPSDSGQGYHAPFYGMRSKAFAVQAAHTLNPPPMPGTTAYRTALRQVRGKGISPELMGTVPSGTTYSKRTVDETLVGVYWAYDGPRELGTPPRLYNQILRDVAIAKANTVEQNARLFALVNAAMGDAGIFAWRDKYKYNLWRPVLGIREHDRSMGPMPSAPVSNIDNDCDPGWLPFGAPQSNSIKRNGTPPFPAYPSGHATFGAAALHLIRRFYGVSANDHSPDSIHKGPFVSDEHNGVNRDNAGAIRPRHSRSFGDGLFQMILENGFSRIWLGVHWSFDAFHLDAGGKPDLSVNIGGVPLGFAIAEDIFSASPMVAPKKSPVGPAV